MISMLEANSDGPLPITYVHAARNRAHHAMQETPWRLATKTAVFYEEPDTETLTGELPSIAGRVDTAWLATHTSPASADYYICGPLSFMKATIGGLRSLGVSDDRLHYEFFGPASEAI